MKSHIINLENHAKHAKRAFTITIVAHSTHKIPNSHDIANASRMVRKLTNNAGNGQKLEKQCEWRKMGVEKKSNGEVLEGGEEARFLESAGATPRSEEVWREEVRRVVTWEGGKRERLRRWRRRRGKVGKEGGGGKRECE